MKKTVSLMLFLTVLVFAAHGQAAPILQVGAPPNPGDTGTYADYVDWTYPPYEPDGESAATSGSTIYLAGKYGNNTANLGGMYTGPLPADSPGAIKDWTDFTAKNHNVKPPVDVTFPGPFAGVGAILLATVPEVAGTLTIDLLGDALGAISPFYVDTGISFFPNDHDPLKDGMPDPPGTDKQYLFFDIGDFLNLSNAVPDFKNDNPPSYTDNGEIKTATVAATGFDWIHFDLIALETIYRDVALGGGIKETRIVSTSIGSNPPSHDVTWRDDGGGGGSGGGGGQSIPEPGTIVLLGTGLLGLGLYGRRRGGRQPQ